MCLNLKMMISAYYLSFSSTSARVQQSTMPSVRSRNLTDGSRTYSQLPLRRMDETLSSSVHSKNQNSSPLLDRLGTTINDFQATSMNAFLEVPVFRNSTYLTVEETNV